MATREIVVSGEDVPVSYQLAGGEAIRPETISADWDGSGASGDFLPCVTIYSPSGLLLSRTFPSEAVVAGDSAEVTYAPF